MTGSSFSKKIACIADALNLLYIAIQMVQLDECVGRLQLCRLGLSWNVFVNIRF